MPNVRIVEITAEDADALDEVRRLFIEYGEWLSPFITASALAEELLALPSPFAASDGGRLLGARWEDGSLCGCVAVKRHSDVSSEIKRLFVRPDCRGSGVGYALFSAALDAACDLGYAEVLVSTVPDFMPAAHRMYERLGFKQTECFETTTQATVDLQYLRYDLGEWCP